MKKLLLFLKVSVPFILILLLSANAKAESPMSFAQVSGSTNGDVLGMTFTNSTSMLITGNFSNIKTVTGIDVPTANGTVQVTTTGVVTAQNALGNLVANPHIEKCAGNIFLIGDNAGSIKIYQLISNTWVLKQTIANGNIASTACTSDRIGIVGTFSGYLAFYNTKTNTLTKPQNVLDGPGEIQMSEKYSVVKCNFPVSSVIIDNSTEQLSTTVPFPSGLATIKGIAAGNEQDLMISGTTFLDPVTYIWNSTAHDWEKIADHSGSGYFSKGWFDVDHTLYLRHSGGYINGTPMNGFVVYKNSTFIEQQVGGVSPVNLIFSQNFVIFSSGNGSTWIGEKTGTTTGIKNNIAKSDIKLYPNPTVEQINITNPGDAREIPLYTFDGKVINTYNLQRNETITIDVSALSNGMYFVDTVPFVKN